MAKKVTAPKTYKPSGGRPLEHLAYLNEREMAYLRSINGNNVERGPKGIMSFADDSASSKGVSRGGQGAVGSGPSRSTGPSRGPTSSPNRTTPSSNSSGPSRGPTSSPNRTAPSSSSRPSSGSTAGSRQGGNGPSSSLNSPNRTAPSNSGMGAVRSGPSSSLSSPNRTAPSNSGVGAARSGPSSSLNAPARTQGSMGGNSDTAARQAAAARDAVKVARESPAFRDDARAGGIKTINVGPMGTPVKIGGQISGAISRVAQGAYRDVTATSPGGGGMGGANARRGSSTIAAGNGLEAPGNIATGSAYGESPSRAAKIDRMEAEMDRRRLSTAYDSVKKITDRVPSYNYDKPIGPMQPDKAALSDQELAARIAEMNRLQSMQDWQFDPNKYSLLKAPAGGGIGELKAPIQMPSEPSFPASEYGGYGQFTTPQDTYNRLGRTVSSGMGVSRVPYSPESQQTLGESIDGIIGRTASALGFSNTPSTPAQSLSVAIPQDPSIAGRALKAAPERILAIEDFPEEAPSGIKAIADRVPTDENWPGNTFDPDTGRVATPQTRKAAGTYTTPYDTPTTPPAPTKPFSRFASEDVPAGYANRYNLNADDTVPRDENGNVVGPETPQRDRVATTDEELISGFSRNPMTGEIGDVQYPEQTMPEKVIERVAPAPFKYAYKGAKLLGERQFKNLSPEERLALLAKFKENNDAYIRNQSPVNDRSDSKTTKNPVPPKPGAKFASESSSDSSGSSEGRRPSVYFMWDVGVNIPSPGEPNYTLYLKYLAERAAAQSALGIS